MKSSETVLCTLDDGLCTLMLNRPEKLNALTLRTFRELAAHLDALPIEDVDCVLLSGAGRSFCAGHDLKDLASGVESFEANIIERLANLPMPVVAAIQGHCYTGGLELALAADIIVAAESARFADTHAKWDLVPVWGLTQRLPRRVGQYKAREMMFASRVYSGREAAEMGLANICVPDENLDAEVSRLCSDVRANSRRSCRAMKKLVTATEGLPLAAGLAWELYRSEGHGPQFGARLEQAKAPSLSKISGRA